jgi:hypothetical protein
LRKKPIVSLWIAQDINIKANDETPTPTLKGKRKPEHKLN